MATMTLFNAFKENALEVMNLGTDQLVVALTNTAPVATNSVLADITQIAYTNLSSRNLTTSASAQTAGTYTLTLTDLVLTASGAVGPFRYVVIYDETPTSPADPLIGFIDYGSSISLANAETFTIDFTGAAITVS